MPNLFRVLRSMRMFCLSAVAMSVCGTISGQVIISQVYGAGGNNGSNYAADFVELFNAGSGAVDISNYALQYASTTGTSISFVAPVASTTQSLSPGHYYLVASTATGATMADFVTSKLAMGATGGRIILTSDATMLTNTCPGLGGTVLDFVGSGASTCYLGSGPAPAPSTTTGDIRTQVCSNTNDNAANFAAVTPAPRNSSTAPTVCGPPSTTVALSESASTVITGNPVTFTAQVSGNGATPGGSVTFSDGMNPIGNGVLTSGTSTWTLTTTSLAIGPHTIKVTYNGDGTYPQNMTSTPASLALTVTPVPVPDIALSISNIELIATSSSKVQTAVVTVAMVAGFNSPVSLSCSGAPGGTRCFFTPATLTTSGNSTLTIAIDGAENHKPGRAGERISLALAALALPVLLWRRKKLRSVMLAVLALGVLSLGMIGCGSSNSTPPGSSTLTVTATGGGVTHTATITLLVQ